MFILLVGSVTSNHPLCMADKSPSSRGPGRGRRRGRGRGVEGWQNQPRPSQRAETGGVSSQVPADPEQFSGLQTDLGEVQKPLVPEKVADPEQFLDHETELGKGGAVQSKLLGSLSSETLSKLPKLTQPAATLSEENVHTSMFIIIMGIYIEREGMQLPNKRY